MKYVFHSDPAHGWLQVPIKEIVELNIEDQISKCSYVKGEFAFLEEDCDASKFIRAKEARGEKVETVEKYYKNSCEIRNYRSFDVGLIKYDL